jgi:hypothetical protein
MEVFRWMPLLITKNLEASDLAAIHFDWPWSRFMYAVKADPGRSGWFGYINV